jgi:hypothetical protein
MPTRTSAIARPGNLRPLTAAPEPRTFAQGMRARNASLIAFLLLNAVPVAGAAQPPPSIEPGARVRLWHVDRCCRSPQVGALLSISADSVVVRADSAHGGARVAVRREAVRSLALPYHAGNHAWRGAGIGALTGAAVGAGVMLSRSCKEDPDYCPGIRAILAAVMGVGGAVVGAVIGGAIGSAYPNVRWVPIPLPNEVGLEPGGGGGLAGRVTLSW